MGSSNRPSRFTVTITIIIGIIVIVVLGSFAKEVGLVPIVVLIGIGVAVFFRYKKRKENYEHIPIELVNETSELLSRIRELNSRKYEYYTDVERKYGKDVCCDSRAAFNRLDFYNCFLNWIDENYDNIPDLINRVIHNREVIQKYESDFKALCDPSLKGWDSSMNISFERYHDAEKMLVSENKKAFPNGFEVEITKQYISSAGNVNLCESEHYGITDLKRAFKDIKSYRKPLKELEESKRIHKQLQDFYKTNLTVPSRDQILKLMSDSEKKDFYLGEIKAVECYFTHSFDLIKWPVPFEKRIQIAFVRDSKSLFIDFLLPNKNCIPNLSDVKNLKYDGSCERKHYPESTINEVYDAFIYQTVLVLIEWVFVLSRGLEWRNELDGVAFNGMVKSIDKATGRDITPYIVSVYESRSSFDQLVLDSVDPKAWFKNAKGISAASLAEVTPISPSFSMRRDDKRFVDGYSVIDDIDDSVNLAAMDWQDFENLIREVFEQEFAGNGGEVRITQASRDGGVDAIAFDPDPIKGGKIVIQAKRYTNVVGVAAVRDLYGTLINEGASKGILVTTANYGNDAYKFAQGKPITLLNGSNLLSLLEKHGRRARINIQEARETMGYSS